MNYQAVAGSLKVKLKVGEKGVNEQDETEKVVADLQAPVVHHSAPVNVEEKDGEIDNVQTAQPSISLISSPTAETIGATVLEATKGVDGTDGQATVEDRLNDGTTRREPHKLTKQMKLKQINKKLIYWLGKMDTKCHHNNRMVPIYVMCLISCSSLETKIRKRKEITCGKGAVAETN